MRPIQNAMPSEQVLQHQRGKRTQQPGEETCDP